MANQVSLSNLAASFSPDEPLVPLPHQLPYNQAKRFFLNELNSYPFTIQNLNKIFKILQSTDPKDRKNLMILTNEPVKLMSTDLETNKNNEISQEMTLLHIALCKLLRTYNKSLQKNELHEMIIKILRLIPKEDLRDCFAKQSYSGYSVMHLAAANWNEDFNLLEEFLQALPPKDRAFCLKIQGGLYDFTPLHLAAYRVVDALSRLPLFKASCRATYALTMLNIDLPENSPYVISIKQLQPILDLIPERKKESIKNIQDLFSRTYLDLIAEHIIPPEKYYMINNVWSGNIPLLPDPGRKFMITIEQIKIPPNNFNTIDNADILKPIKDESEEFSIDLSEEFSSDTFSEESELEDKELESLEDSINPANNLTLYYLTKGDVKI